MTYLPSLIKKIDDYCSLADSPARWKKWAQDYSGGYSSPEEPEESEEGGGNPPHYDSLLNMSRQVDDPGLSQQLQTLAELYRYAIQLGGGYSTIAQAINNLKTMYSDGSDSDIESILNGMISELAKAAGGIRALSGKDNPSFVQRLVQLKQDIEARNQEERSGALDAYQEEISGQGKGAQTEETSEDLAESGLTPEQSDIVNPAALGFADKDDPKTNAGWHTTGSGKAYKNWKEYYNNERVSYETDLVNETDPNVRQTLEQLIRLLPTISDTTQQALDLSNALRSDVDKPEEQARVRTALDEINTQLQRLKYERRNLRNRIRDIQLQKEKQKISDELQEASQKYKTSADPERKERFRREEEVLKQKLALNELARSTNVYKAKKRNYLLEMLRQMSGGDWPSQDWISKQQQKIDTAKTVTKEDYDRVITEQRGKQQARLVTPSYEATRGGARIPMEKLPEEKQIDLEKASFSALVYQFQIDIASATQAARQIIYETGKKDNKGKKILKTEYKELIDEISEAIRKKDRPTLYAAQNKLRAAVANDVNVAKNQLKGYVEVIRLEPHFRKLLEGMKELTKSKKGEPPKLDESGNLVVDNFSEADKMGLGFVMNDLHRLRVLYTKYYIEISGIKFKQDIAPRFKKVIEDMGRIEIHLRLKLKVRRPESKEFYPEKSPSAQEIARQQREKLKNSSINNRMIMFKQALSKRLAQEAVPEVGVDKTTADKLANEMFDTIYDQAYQKMLSELQD